MVLVLACTQYAHRVFHSTRDKILTTIGSSEFQSVGHRADLTSGAARTRSFMLLSYAQCIHT